MWLYCSCGEKNLIKKDKSERVRGRAEIKHDHILTLSYLTTSNQIDEEDMATGRGKENRKQK